MKHDSIFDKVFCLIVDIEFFLAIIILFSVVGDIILEQPSDIIHIGAATLFDNEEHENARLIRRAQRFRV